MGIRVIKVILGKGYTECAARWRLVSAGRRDWWCWDPAGQSVAQMQGNNKRQRQNNAVSLAQVQSRMSVAWCDVWILVVEKAERVSSGWENEPLVTRGVVWKGSWRLEATTAKSKPAWKAPCRDGPCGNKRPR